MKVWGEICFSRPISVVYLRGSPEFVMKNNNNRKGSTAGYPEIGMQIKNILPKSHVMLGLEGSRQKVLNTLATPLLKNKVVSDIKNFLTDVDTREKQITMQVNPLVALPHARSNAVRRLGLAVGVCKTGISYNDDSEPECRLLFLIAIPAYAPTAHLPLLQHLAAFAHDPERVEKLLQSRTPGRAAGQITRFTIPK